jgi:hypothetical protein
MIYGRLPFAMTAVAGPLPVLPKPASLNPVATNPEVTNPFPKTMPQRKIEGM